MGGCVKLKMLTESEMSLTKGVTGQASWGAESCQKTRIVPHDIKEHSASTELPTMGR